MILNESLELHIKALKKLFKYFPIYDRYYRTEFESLAICNLFFSI